VWLFGFGLFAAAAIASVISVAAIRVRKAPIGDRLFEGILGHALVAVAALIVAGGLYEHLRTEHRWAKVCTAFDRNGAEPVGGGQPYLLYVRDGIRNSAQGGPLLEKEILMKPDAKGTQYCADVRYARKFGFQFKVFVLYPPELSADAERDRREEIRKHLCEAFPQQDYDQKPPRVVPGDGDYCEEWPHRALRGKDRWRVWVLLRGYEFIQDGHTVIENGREVWEPYWNNFYRPCGLEETCPID
jgi:hypothetical protein